MITSQDLDTLNALAKSIAEKNTDIDRGLVIEQLASEVRLRVTCLSMAANGTISKVEDMPNTYRNLSEDVVTAIANILAIAELLNTKLDKGLEKSIAKPDNKPKLVRF